MFGCDSWAAVSASRRKRDLMSLRNASAGSTWARSSSSAAEASGSGTRRVGKVRHEADIVAPHNDTGKDGRHGGRDTTSRWPQMVSTAAVLSGGGWNGVCDFQDATSLEPPTRDDSI